MTIAPQQRFSPMAVAGILKKQVPLNKVQFGMRDPADPSEAPTAVSSAKSPGKSLSAVEGAIRQAAQLKTIRSAFEHGLAAFAQGNESVADEFFERAIALEIEDPHGNGVGASFVIAREYAKGKPSVGIAPNPGKAEALYARLLKHQISLSGIFSVYAKGSDGVARDIAKANAILEQMLASSEGQSARGKIRIASMLADSIGQEETPEGETARTKARGLVDSVARALLTKPISSNASQVSLDDNSALLSILKLYYTVPYSDRGPYPKPVFLTLGDPSQKVLKNWVQRQLALYPNYPENLIRELKPIYDHLLTLATDPSKRQNVGSNLGYSPDQVATELDALHMTLRDLVTKAK
ncbi:MAG: hypothetical protein K2X01_00565 [Cyanobacteria bacterium]|nr:hypothetical protein [Cyanobacteriota bacterium]